MPDPREMAEAVARWCGYTNIRLTEMFDQVADYKGHMRVRLPNFAASLDAMADVERLLAERGLLRRYREELDSMWRADDMGMDRAEYLIRLTALQRLQAAARVIEEVFHG